MDIDFDELDRAVNSLMEKRAQKQAVQAPSKQGDAIPKNLSASPSPASIPDSLSAPTKESTAPSFSTPNNMTEDKPAFRPAIVEEATETPSQVPALEQVAKLPESVIEPVTELQPELPAKEAAPSDDTIEANGFPHNPTTGDTGVISSQEPADLSVSAAPTTDENIKGKPQNQNDEVRELASEQSNPTTVPDQEQPPVIARRSSGRFMDVIRPSGATATKSTMPSRSGVTLQPIDSYSSSTEPEPVTTQMINDDRASEETELDSLDQNQTDTHSIESNSHQRLVIQPDPAHLVELHTDAATLAPKDVPDYESIMSEAEGSTDSDFVEEGLMSEKVSDELEGVSVKDESPISVSDSLSIDAVQSGEPPATGQSKTLEATIDEIEADEYAASPTEDSQLPSGAAANSLEFDRKLMSIEAMDTMSDTSTPDGQELRGDAAPIGSEENQVRSMFDTATQQPTLDRLPHEKRSGVGTLLLIVLFALLGIGAGAAVYYFLLLK